VPWPDETMRRLGLMAAAHHSLPRPENAGRVIGIKRDRGRINAGDGQK
jgi:acyl-CoA thioester hydrolase